MRFVRPARPAARSFLLAALLAAALAAPAAAQGGRRVDADPAASADAGAGGARADKSGLAPGSPAARIESGVAAQVRRLAGAGTETQGALPLAIDPDAGLPVDATGRLYVRIEGDEAALHAVELAGLGAQVVAVAAPYDFLEAWVPYDRVSAVAGLAWVRLVGLPGRPVPEVGSRESQGDAIHRADLARSTFGIDGAGATVGVISDGVSNLAASQGTADLPAGVQVGDAGAGDEGTAMLEIVHDLAPGAALAFNAGGGGAAAMIAAQNWLVGTAGAGIVVDDLWLPREPYFEDGPVAANAAQLAANDDVVYVTSAGNRAQRHVPGTFHDAGSRTIGALGTFRPHDFGGGDVLLDVRLRNPSGTGVRHTIVLQWAERFGLAATDLDLYLINATGTAILASSTTLQAGAGDPVELLDFTYNGPDNQPAFLLVDYAGALPAPEGLTFKIAGNGPRFLQGVVAAGSINPHAGHPSVFAAGAIDQADPGADDPEAFSSHGPAVRFFPSPAQRDKPDAMGIDGVAVTGVGGFPVPFFGTSAAAPHAAGIAALVRAADPTLDAAQVRDLLRSTAVDLGPPGFDAATGAGRLDAFNLLAEVLNQPPVADAGNDTTVECSGAAGTPVRLDGTRSYDPDGDPLTYAWSATGIAFDDPASPTPTGNFPLGSTTVDLTVSDGQFESSDEVVVTVEDTTPPALTVALSPDRLWPPNHKLATIEAAILASDLCDDAPVVRLLSIASDQPDEGLGDGDQPNDIEGADFHTDDRSFELRSERAGLAGDRTYTVCYEAEDASGNRATACATVVVTHDQSAIATLHPATAGGSVWIDGATIDFDPDQPLATADLRSSPPVLGSDVFRRHGLSVENLLPSPNPTIGLDGEVVVPADEPVSWSVDAATLGGLLAGAASATVYARVEVGGVGYLVALPIDEPPPAGLLAGAGAGMARAGAPPVAATTPEAPQALALAARMPLHAGGTITYALPAAAAVRLALYALNGRRVATLAQGEAGPGWHQAALPAGLASGMYFARLDAGGERALARVLVVP